MCQGNPVGFGEGLIQAPALCSELDNFDTFNVAQLDCPDCRDAMGNCAAAGLNDGVEDTVAGATGLVCAASDNTIAQGNLPWVTLGTPQFDTWGHYYS